MKRYLLSLVIIACGNAMTGQTFAEVSFNTSIISSAAGDIDFDSYRTKNSGITFQIGKFKNERKMRTFTLGYRKTTSVDEENPVVYSNQSFPYGRHEATRTLSSTAIMIGYESKLTFGITEFDDPWNYYTLFSYYLSFLSNKEETVTVPANYMRLSYDIKPSSVDLGITAGMGIARKFTKKTYAFGDFRYQLPVAAVFTSTTYGGYGLFVNFGVRHIIK